MRQTVGTTVQSGAAATRGRRLALLYVGERFRATSFISEFSMEK